jgi:hypothetical protein
MIVFLGDVRVKENRETLLCKRSGSFVRPNAEMGIFFTRIELHDQLSQISGSLN